MKKRIGIFYILAAIAAFSGCSTEVDLNASWKEKMIIYGLLDQGKSVQYINVTKAYLGEGNALDMAKIGDSIYYGPNDLQVVLTRVRDGKTIDSEVLQYVSSPVKDPGVFVSDSAVLFKAVKPLFSNSEYQLQVQNIKTGYIATATTALIQARPIPNEPGNYYPIFSIRQTEVNFVNPSNGLYNNFPFNLDNTVANAAVYQYTIRFNYFEKTDANSLDSVKKYVDWVFPPVTVNHKVSETPVELIGEDFYRYIGNKIEVNGTYRVIGNIEFRLIAAGDELNNYYRVSRPSSNINQDRAIYTNIENGYGIFSCRFESAPLVKQLQNASRVELINGQYTQKLNFRR